MTMPNFLILSGGKSGTTSLYYYLNQHPQVYMSPIKEPSFFAYEGQKPDFRGPGDKWGSRYAVTDLQAYQALFQGVSDEMAIGEASTVYLHSLRAPERIRHYIPNVKLVAVLRDPVERAHSAHMMRVRQGREPIEDLAQAIQKEQARMQANWAPSWYYVHVGFYYTHLRRYFDTFDESQIQVHLFQDLKTDPGGVLQAAFRFLGVDERFVPNMSTRYNPGGLPKRKAWHVFLTRLRPINIALKPLLPSKLRRRLGDFLRNLQERNLVQPPPLSPETRRELIQVYREDILQLQDLIQRDLSKWLK